MKILIFSIIHAQGSLVFTINKIDTSCKHQNVCKYVKIKLISNNKITSN